MDSETASNTLGTIISACVAISGLLAVAGIFYLGQLRSHVRNYEWLKEGDPKLYFGIWIGDGAIFLIGFLIPMFFALGIAYEGVSLIVQVPGGNVDLDSQIADQVESIAKTFHVLLLIVAGFVSGVFVLGFLLPALSDYYASLGKSMDQLGLYATILLLSAASEFRKGRSSLLSEGEDMQTWAKREYAKGEGNEFHKFVHSRLPKLIKQLQGSDAKIYSWVQIAAPIIYLVVLVTWFVIWSYI